MTTSILTTFETNLENFFATVKTDVYNFAVAFVPAAEQTLEIAFEDLAKIAGQAVVTEGLKVASGAEKFGNAVANVVQTVEAQGKTVAIQTAQTVVQLAVVKAQQIANAAPKV